MLRHAAKSGIKRGLTDTCKGAMRASRMNFAEKEDNLQVSDHLKTLDNKNTCGMRTCNSNYFSEQTVNRLSAGFSNSPAFHSQVDVSKSYNGITNEKMEEFLTRQKLVYKVRANGQIVIKECPFCSKPHNNKVSNLWTLNLKENSGAFLCFRCGTHGSWYDFVRHILGDTVNFDKPMSSAHLLSQPIFPNQTVGSNDPLNEQTLLRLQEEEELRLREEKTSLVIEDLQSAHQNMLHSIASLRQLETQAADTGDASAQADGRLDASGVDLQNLETLRYLISKTDPGARHLSEETLAAYKIGIGSDVFKTEGGESTSVPTITFPLFRPTSKKSKSETDCNILDNQHYDCVRAKVRGAGKENKHFQRFKPSGGQIGFFGLNLLRPDCKVVVLTEGEFDAMAVFEATGLPAVSLPNGASNLPTQLIAHLERVERVYLWMDNDEAGQLNVESFANKLGLKRTYIVHTDLDSKDCMLT